jgi:fumarylpyruvate hydrolase
MRRRRAERCSPPARSAIPEGRIALKANGKVRQQGDLAQMIWNVPEIIVKLSEMVELGAGDIIMTGTPSGVAATVPGDKLQCEIDGVGTLTVTIGPPAA